MEKDFAEMASQKFNALKSRAKSIFNVAGLTKYNGDDIAYTFYEEITKFIKDLENAIKPLAGYPHLLHSINNWIEELELDIKSNKKTGSKKLTEEHLSNRIKLKDELYRISTLPFISAGPVAEKTNPKAAKMNDFNKPALTQKETALVMLYLREHRVFLRDTTDDLLANCFEKLTGFSENTLRQSISGESKSNKAMITENPEHFKKIASLFEDVIKQIRLETPKIK